MFLWLAVYEFDLNCSQFLHDLVNVIVLILLEPGVAELIRALNVLPFKIFDGSDHNAISSALLKLLHECTGTELHKTSVLGSNSNSLTLKSW